ncbi:PepSY domain-containing protein [Arthrobacter sp. JSM 101049]|uniref:PepSY domain-containing protein n=1 Tax=Arthrobacter sp. JSM 101049 TaxID=929097 RepID=UPI003562250E
MGTNMQPRQDARPRDGVIGPHPTSQRRFAPVLAVSASALLALSACSGSGGTGESAPAMSPSSSSGTSSMASESSTGTTGSTASASASSTAGSSTPAGGRTSLEDAAQTALDEVPGSTLTSIETESDGDAWEVQVVTDDGTEHEIDISMSDGTVIGQPVTKNEDAQDKKKHQDRVAAAKLDYKEAAEKLRDAVPNARIVELNLDTERGTTVWEGDLVDDGGTKHAVAVDAASGKVVKNAVDSDD